LAMLLLVAFGSKAAMFPLFFWLPASYHTPPVAVSAIFAGLLTKVGVYSLIRVFTLLFAEGFEQAHSLLLILSGATMVTGVLGAVAQSETRRILAFHSVSQAGYMLMGLALFTPAGLAGALLFMIHHSVVKSNLFLISGIARRLGGSFELGRLGGLYLRHPALAALFLVLVWPFVALVLALAAGAPWAAALAACAILVLAASGLPPASRLGWRMDWLAWLGLAGAVVIVILARAVALTLWRGGIAWRGHFHPLAELRGRGMPR